MKTVSSRIREFEISPWINSDNVRTKSGCNFEFNARLYGATPQDNRLELRCPRALKTDDDDWSRELSCGPLELSRGHFGCA